MAKKLKEQSADRKLRIKNCEVCSGCPTTVTVKNKLGYTELTYCENPECMEVIDFKK